MRRLLIGVLLVMSAIVLHSPSARAADTLVVSSADGFKPGVAKSWTGSGTMVTFVLQDGSDAQQIAKTLRERLAQAKVEVAGGKLTVSGVPMAALLDQLSTLSLSSEGDPLATLASLGGGAQSGEAAEAGGSIRASKPTPLPSAIAGATAAGMVAAHDPAERLEAEVLEVERAAFPKVELKLRVRRGATEGRLKGKLGAGKIFAAPMLVVTAGAPLDLSNPDQQRNLGAYYLKKGDRVLLHASEPEGGSYAVDWIERK